MPRLASLACIVSIGLSTNAAARTPAAARNAMASPYFAASHIDRTCTPAREATTQTDTTATIPQEGAQVADGQSNAGEHAGGSCRQ